MADTATETSRGQRIRALRLAYKPPGSLTQSALARAIGVETQSISLWENDKVGKIEPENLLALVEFFKVDPAYLGYELPSTTPPVNDEWLRQAIEQQNAKLEEMHAILKQLQRKATRP